MDNISPFLLTCGVFCLWPLLFGVIGFMVGSRRIAFRSPIYQSERVGYTSDKVQQDKATQTARSAGK